MGGSGLELWAPPSLDCQNFCLMWSEHSLLERTCGMSPGHGLSMDQPLTVSSSTPTRMIFLRFKSDLASSQIYTLAVSFCLEDTTHSLAWPIGPSTPQILPICLESSLMVFPQISSASCSFVIHALVGFLMPSITPLTLLPTLAHQV